MTEEADEDDLQQIRASLEEQIEEHRTALLELGQLAPSADLQQMQNELQQAITETQATLTELLGQAPHAVPPTKEAQLEPGSCYRFRSQNGQWLAAKLLALASDTATLQILCPSQAYMLQPVRCAVAAVDPTPFSRQQLQGSQALGDIPLGTVLYVRSPDSGLYQPAELEGVQAGGRQVVVTFVCGARGVVVPAASTCLRLAADLQDADAAQEPVQALQVSQSEGDGASTDGSDMEDSHSDVEQDAAVSSYTQQPAAAGAAMQEAQAAMLRAADLGPQTDTAHFAAWEEHTRGIGSKLMAGMGYVSGRGLGSSRPGRVAPLEVHLRRPGSGLGHGPAAAPGQAKKRKRGGRAQQQRKIVANAKAQRRERRGEVGPKQAATGDTVFALLNSVGKLRHQEDGMHTAGPQEQASPAAEDWGASLRKTRKQQQQRPKSPDLKALASQQDALDAAAAKVTRLQGMSKRHSHASKAIQQQLAEAQQQLSALHSQHEGHQKKVLAAETQKRWMKF